MKPPMVFTKENVDEVISTLNRVFKEYRYKLEELRLQSITQEKSTEMTITKEHRPRKPLFEADIKSI